MMGLTVYHCDDGNAKIEIEAASAVEAAQEYVDGGDWGDGNEGVTETKWVSVYVWAERSDDEGHEDRECYTIALEPDELKCSASEHFWQEISVWGHGGGVIVTEQCSHCGLQMVTDTWAQNPETGIQGLRSVSYDASEQNTSARLPDGYTLARAQGRPGATCAQEYVWVVTDGGDGWVYSGARWGDAMTAAADADGCRE